MTKVKPRANAFVQSGLAISIRYVFVQICFDFVLRDVNKYTFFENK